MYADGVPAFSNVQMWTIWTIGVSLYLFGPSTAKGVILEPCNEDGFIEVLAGQKAQLTCRAEGHVVWRLGARMQSVALAECTGSVCNTTGLFIDMFEVTASDHQTSIITIDTENKTKINVLLANSSVECVHNAGTDMAQSSSCGINYVFPSEHVSCNALNTSWNFHVSCVIGSAYSSLKIYRCHLFRLKYSIESLKTVTMVTSPTREKITMREVKVSGSCQFIVTLPPEERHSELFVSISPGGRNYSVKISTDDKLVFSDKASSSCLGRYTLHGFEEVAPISSRIRTIPNRNNAVFHALCLSKVEESRNLLPARHNGKARLTRLLTLVITLYNTKTECDVYDQQWTTLKRIAI